MTTADKISERTTVKLIRLFVVYNFHVFYNKHIICHLIHLSSLRLLTISLKIVNQLRLKFTLYFNDRAFIFTTSPPYIDSIKIEWMKKYCRMLPSKTNNCFRKLCKLSIIQIFATHSNVYNPYNYITGHIHLCNIQIITCRFQHSLLVQQHLLINTV